MNAKTSPEPGQDDGAPRNTQVLVQSMKRRISPIWIVPLVSVLVGLWLVVDFFLAQGPEITLTFENAAGIKADKTLLKYRKVDVGVVSDVNLTDDLQKVKVTVQLKPDMAELLHEDSQFWVVRPIVRGTTISGLSTLISGAYVELSPGTGAQTKKRNFEGLDLRPEAPAGTPGKRLTLVAKHAGVLNVGSPVLYEGYRVGTVESSVLDVPTQQVRYSIFVEAPYDAMLTENVRFWTVNGINAELGPDGINLTVAPLLALLSGGVSFSIPDEGAVGPPIADGAVFHLYKNRAATEQVPYEHHARFVVQFKQSVRGLNPGAPVRYRGINIGTVERLMLAEMTEESTQDAYGRPIPVLVSIDPGRLAFSDSLEGVGQTEALVARSVENGMRATMQSGNLLTGTRFIGLDYYPDAKPSPPEIFSNHRVIPVIASGFDHIQEQISALLEKLNALPLESTVASANGSLEELRGTLAAARTVVENEDTQEIPANLQKTIAQLNKLLGSYSEDSEFQRELVGALRELKSTLQGVEGVAAQLEQSPNSIVFGAKKGGDPEIEAP